MKLLLTATLLLMGSTAYAGSSVPVNNYHDSYSEANVPEVTNANDKAFIDVNRPVGGTSIRYYSSTATAMQTVNQNGYKYTVSGCTSSKSGWREIDEALDLPNKSKIVSFTALGKDTSNNASGKAYLSKINGAGNYTILKSYDSGTTNKPNRFNIGGYLNHTLSHNEGLLVRLAGATSDIELCGFRIGYVPPDVAGDVIFVTNFYR